MAVKITQGDQARAALKAGVDALADTVKITLGPGGRTVVIHTRNNTFATKDGVTVARNVILSDPDQEAGAQLVRQVAGRTVDEVGDGTTTATVLAQAMLAGGIKALAAGANPMQVKRGMDAAVERICAYIEANLVQDGTDPELIRQVATIASNSDALVATLVADTFNKAGKSGNIMIRPSRNGDTYAEFGKGVTFARGYYNPSFAQDASGRVAFEASELEPIYVLIHEGKIPGVRELTPVMEHVIRRNGRLVVIAEEYSGEVMGLLALNNRNIQSKLFGRIIAIAAPGYGAERMAWLNDLALLTGGRVFGLDRGLSLNPASLQLMGEAKSIEATPNHTTLARKPVEGIDPVTGTVEQMQGSLESLAQEPNAQKQVRERIARLLGGVATIYVGGETEAEQGERADRFDDAVRAVRVAAEKGVVPGGGMALLLAATAESAEEQRSLPPGTADNAMGVKIILEAARVPFETILENAGHNPKLFYAHLFGRNNEFMPGIAQNKTPQPAPHMGVDASQGKVVDMFVAGIIDPAGVTITALKTAASIAGLMLTTGALVTEIVPIEPRIVVEGLDS